MQGAIATLARERSDALCVGPSRLFRCQGVQLVTFASASLIELKTEPEWDRPAVLQPCQRAKLAKGFEDKGARHVRETQQQNRRDRLDIGKNSFHIVGQDRRGALVLRQKWSRGQVEARLANLPPCLIGMEACTGAASS